MRRARQKNNDREGTFMLHRTRFVIARAALAAAVYLIAAPALADSYPSRPIRLLHGFAAGGAADAQSRIIADGLSKRLGQPVIVEAKPGAGGNIAADAVAKSAPDGYTLGLVTGAHAISAATYKSLSYHPTDSFAMVSTLVYYALVVAVRNDHPAKSLGDLVAMAKAKPASISFGSVGFGSTHHLAGELLNAAAGMEMVHVPYRGDSQSTTALLGGDVPVVVGTAVLLAPQIEGGTLRGLAVTSPTRIPLLPNVPSADEAGLKGFDVRTWAGLVAPKGTEPAVVAKLNAAVLDALKDPDVKSRLETAVGGEVRGSTPAEMKKLIETEIAKWSAVVDKAKIPKI
jgi:tripartite-type tricarboxylate transporter receptor subunit TctC